MNTLEGSKVTGYKTKVFLNSFRLPPMHSMFFARGCQVLTMRTKNIQVQAANSGYLLPLRGETRSMNSEGRAYIYFKYFIFIGA